jgi:hypothetical protein
LRIFVSNPICRFRDIFDDYVVGMKEAVEAEEAAANSKDTK